MISSISIFDTYFFSPAFLDTRISTLSGHSIINDDETCGPPFWLATSSDILSRKALFNLSSLNWDNMFTLTESMLLSSDVSVSSLDISMKLEASSTCLPLFKRRSFVKASNLDLSHPSNPDRWEILISARIKDRWAAWGCWLSAVLLQGGYFGVLSRGRFLSRVACQPNAIKIPSGINTARFVNSPLCMPETEYGQVVYPTRPLVLLPKTERWSLR